MTTAWAVTVYLVSQHPTLLAVPVLIVVAVVALARRR